MISILSGDSWTWVFRAVPRDGTLRGKGVDDAGSSSTCRACCFALAPDPGLQTSVGRGARVSDSAFGGGAEGQPWKRKPPTVGAGSGLVTCGQGSPGASPLRCCLVSELSGTCRCQQHAHRCPCSDLAVPVGLGRGCTCCLRPLTDAGSPDAVPWQEEALCLLTRASWDHHWGTPAGAPPRLSPCCSAWTAPLALRVTRPSGCNGVSAERPALPLGRSLPLLRPLEPAPVGPGQRPSLFWDVGIGSVSRPCLLCRLPLSRAAVTLLMAGVSPGCPRHGRWLAAPRSWIGYTPGAGRELCQQGHLRG